MTWGRLREFLRDLISRSFLQICKQEVIARTVHRALTWRCGLISLSLSFFLPHPPKITS